MSSSKRRKNKKLHQRRRKLTRPPSKPDNSSPYGAVRLPPPIRVVRGPSELDQISVFITEPELGLPETTFSEVRALAAELPFETAMLNVAQLQARIEPVLRNPGGHWQVAQEFYVERPELLAGYQRILDTQRQRTIFSPQPLALLMRVLIDVAADERLREWAPGEFPKLQNAVLGAHSALESALDALPLPSVENVLAYEVQAATFFRREQPLEEMTRHRELLHLATADDRLKGSANRVPVDEWLAASGITASEQWAIGFGLGALTHAFVPPVLPRALAEHVDDMLAKLEMEALRDNLSVISASRAEFRESFAALPGADETLAWELRPFKATPFLRLEDGSLVLLAPTWLLSWLGEGLHYRALTHAQRSEGSTASARYTRFSGEVVERYALDLAEIAVRSPALVFGEQPYGVGGGQRTSDVAIAAARDLVLFEIHARRVSALAAVTGTAAAATLEVSTLLVEKIDQIGVCIAALLCGQATLPGIDIAEVDRIWPVVVSVGHVMQTQNLWKYMRSKMDPAKTASLSDPRVHALQVIDIGDYEKVMGLIESGEDLPAMLARKTASVFRERDLAAWLHGDPGAPSDQPRLSALGARWDAMADEVTLRGQRAGEPEDGSR